MEMNEKKLDSIINKIKFLMGDPKNDYNGENGIIMSSPQDMKDEFNKLMQTFELRIFDDNNILMDLNLYLGDSFVSGEDIISGNNFQVYGTIRENEYNESTLFVLKIEYDSVRRLKYYGHHYNNDDESIMRGIFEKAYIYKDPIFDLKMNDVDEVLLKLAKLNKQKLKKELLEIKDELNNIDNLKNRKIEIEHLLKEELNNDKIRSN